MQPHIAIIGGGFGGICAAAQLVKDGFTNFTIFEKSDSIGGTWHSNRYPGAACDIPSVLYSFSFAKNYNWSSRYASQREILEYLCDVADELHLAPHLHLNTAVSSMEWDIYRRMWTITTTDTLRPSHQPPTLHRANYVILATGQLSSPYTPAVAGKDAFLGQQWHSAEWPHELQSREGLSAALHGRTVAVVGCAASAIQFVPHLVEAVGTSGQVVVFQRSPSYVLPRTVAGALALALGRAPSSAAAVPRAPPAPVEEWSVPSALSSISGLSFITASTAYSSPSPPRPCPYTTAPRALAVVLNDLWAIATGAPPRDARRREQPTFAHQHTTAADDGHGDSHPQCTHPLLSGRLREAADSTRVARATTAAGAARGAQTPTRDADPSWTEVLAGAAAAAAAMAYPLGLLVDAIVLAVVAIAAILRRPAAAVCLLVAAAIALAYDAMRCAAYLAHDALFMLFTLSPSHVVVRAFAAAARLWLRACVPSETKRAALHATSSPGCKRVLVSDTFYAAVAGPNVSILTHPVRGIDRRGIVFDSSRVYDGSGLEREAARPLRLVGSTRARDASPPHAPAWACPLPTAIAGPNGSDVSAFGFFDPRGDERCRWSSSALADSARAVATRRSAAAAADALVSAAAAGGTTAAEAIAAAHAAAKASVTTSADVFIGDGAGCALPCTSDDEPSGGTCGPSSVSAPCRDHAATSQTAAAVAAAVSAERGARVASRLALRAAAAAAAAHGVHLDDGYISAGCEPLIDDVDAHDLYDGTATSAVRVPVDVIVWATGFRALDFAGGIRITAGCDCRHVGVGGDEPAARAPSDLMDGHDDRARRGGVHTHTLADVWAGGGGPSAYYGILVPRFPNLFILYGPNTNLGHSSIVFMLEMQAALAVQLISACEAVCRGVVTAPAPEGRAALSLAARWGHPPPPTRTLRPASPTHPHYICGDLSRAPPRTRAVRVTSAATSAQVTSQQDALSRTMFATGCRSWYTDASGRIVTNWHASTTRYWWQLRRPDMSAFVFD